MTKRSVRRFRSVSMAVTGAAIAVFTAFAPAASASAASVAALSSGGSLASAASGHHVAKAKIYHMTTPYGTVTYGWRPFTSASGRVIPRSASGCNKDVCINIEGESVFVDDWNTQAYYSGEYVCTYSNFYVNGKDIREGTFVCGGAGVFFTDWAAKKTYGNGTQLCNQWHNLPGRACETIER
jgi:hypothetical protein